MLNRATVVHQKCKLCTIFVHVAMCVTELTFAPITELTFCPLHTWSTHSSLRALNERAIYQPIDDTLHLRRLASRSIVAPVAISLH